MTDLTLGQRIAAKRNELSLSQSALGEQLGVSRQSVFKWESDAAVPEIDKLIALSKLFGVSLDWLLGMADTVRTEAAPEAPKQDFTERERQILEQLARPAPAEPRWKKWLVAGAAICTAAALLLSGLSFHKWKQTSKALEEAQTQIDRYTAYIQSLISDGMVVVKDFDYDCTPDVNMSEANVQMRITPYGYQEGQSACLLVLLGGEVRVANTCRWTGVAWETEFRLSATDGYEFQFKLTDETGLEMNQTLRAPLLSQMGLNLSWPTDHRVTWSKWEALSDALIFTDMHIKIPLPGVFRYTDNLWESCQLVLADGTGAVLTQFDLMNRSNHSAEIDFGKSDVDFTTQSVQLLFPEQAVGKTLHLYLNGTLTTGHQFSIPVDQWKMTSDGLTNQFKEPRT